VNHAITLHNIAFSYHEKTVFEQVSFGLKKGEFLAIIGPNGSGKSTLLKLLLGLLKPLSGTLSFDTNAETKKALGYVPQSTDMNLEFPISALDVVLTGQKSTHTKALKQSAYEALCSVGMEALAHERIGRLSGGQRQRVFIARALMGDPNLLILDEPTSNIDAEGAQEIFDLLKSLTPHKTVITVSHDLTLLLGYATKVLSMGKNPVMHDAPEIPKELLNTHNGHLCEVELLNHFNPEANAKCCTLKDFHG